MRDHSLDPPQVRLFQLARFRLTHNTLSFVLVFTLDSGVGVAVNL
jgi:hypothetical protein